MDRFILIPGFALSLLALSGWPVLGNMWIRAGICIAILIACLLCMTWLGPDTRSTRFRQASGKRAILPGILRVGTLIFATGALYGILVFGPEFTGRWSDEFIRFVSGKSGPNLEEEDWDEYEDEEIVNGRYVVTEVSRGYDPEGSFVPDVANIQTSSKPEIRLEPKDAPDAKFLAESGPIYISSFSYDTFDGERWTNARREQNARLLRADSSGNIQLRPSNSAPTCVYRILQGYREDQWNMLNTVQLPTQVQTPEITQISEGTWVLPAEPQPDGIYQYHAASSPVRLENLLKTNAEILPGRTEATFSDSSNHVSLDEIIQTWVADVPTDIPLSQRLTNVQNRLRQEHDYSLQVNYPESDKTALENFLTNPENRTGFCVHFATAGALIARKLGFPSRITYGWTGGQVYQSHNQIVFRGAHSHAWTEIFLQGHGWVIFDTTPTSAQPATTTPEPGESPPELDEFRIVELEDRNRKQADSGLSPAWILGIVGCSLVLVLFGLFLTLRFTRARRSRGGGQQLRNVPAPGYLKLFQRACAKQGIPIPAGRTLLQQVRILQEKDSPPEFADALLDYHYDVTYRNSSRNSRTEKQLSQQIKAWSA